MINTITAPAFASAFSPNLSSVPNRLRRAILAPCGYTSHTVVNPKPRFRTKKTRTMSVLSGRVGVVPVVMVVGEAWAAGDATPRQLC